MTMSIAPVKVGEVSAEVADRLAKMYRTSDSGSSDSLPNIKINYDENSRVAAPGEWVVGQQKSGDEIIDEGDRAIAFIPIVMRNAYSLYDQKNIENNCTGPLFSDFSEIVRGNKHKQICGKKTCSFAMEGRCRAQKVVFGVALTKKSGMIDCVGYFSGVSYMPVSDYMKWAEKMEVGGITRRVPPFSYVAALSSEKHRKGTITYFVPILKRGWVVSKDEDIAAMGKKRDEILKTIEARSVAAAVIAVANASHGGDSAPAVDPDTLDASFKEVESGFTTKAVVAAPVTATKAVAPGIHDWANELEEELKGALPHEPEPEPLVDSGGDFSSESLEAEIMAALSNTGS